MGNSTSRLRDAAALTFASFFPLAMALIYFVALDSPEAQTNLAFIVAIGAGKCVQFLFPAIYVALFERERLRFTYPTTRGLVLGIGFGLIVAALTFALYFGWIRHISSIAEQAPAIIFQRLQQFGLPTPLRYLELAIFVCCGHSLLEEYYWRWFVFSGMRRLVPMPAAIVLSSIGFMLHHIVILGIYLPGHFWTLAIPFSFCVAFGGGVWAWLYQRSESLYAPWVSHCLVDAALMGLGYVMLADYWQ